MLLVPCPSCGPRNATDLAYLGEIVPRPEPAEADPDTWRDYLYMRDNPAAWVTEQWYCRAGCRRYFSVERDTATNRFRQGPLPLAWYLPEGER
ncbi:MAG: sarcosine oxidase subunit delta [Acidimicrobiia bacterium]